MADIHRSLFLRHLRSQPTAYVRHQRKGRVVRQGTGLSFWTREAVQQDADRATYERRADAVHRERAIAENELANQIELAQSIAPRAVVVTRPTELDGLIARHGTRQQAAFFLRSRNRSLDEVAARHQALHTAVATVAALIPADWRRGQVGRAISTGSSSALRTSSWWSARTAWWPTWPSTSTVSP